MLSPGYDMAVTTMNHSGVQLLKTWIQKKKKKKKEN